VNAELDYRSAAQVSAGRVGLRWVWQRPAVASIVAGQSGGTSGNRRGFATLDDCAGNPKAVANAR
jgi:hypothetical protein